MREVISIHLGQAGVQVGNECWELYCLEHGINPDGTLKQIDKSNNNNNNQLYGSFGCFFQETRKNKLVPRSVLLDLDPMVIDQIRTGTYRELFHPGNLISGKEDASNLFARGYYTIGKEYVDNCLNSIRKLVESCDNLEGIMMYHSVGGGTGSGFGSLLAEKIKEEYSRYQLLGFMILPSPDIGTNPFVESYNSNFAAVHMLESHDATVVLDNKALYEQCQKLDIENPTFRDINRIIAQLSSSLTAPLRYQGCLNSSLKKLQMNLIPYPRMHFLIASLAPLISQEQGWSKEYFSVSQMMQAAFEPSSQLASCNPRLSKFVACSMMFRGDVSPSEVLTSITSIKKKRTINFVDWCPTGFKIGITSQPQSFVTDGIQPKTSCCLISNSTSVVSIFSNISYKCQQLYYKRAFAFWYCGEGQEEGEFTESMETIAVLEKDYEEAEDLQQDPDVFH